ncbi:sensor histidine kinase [Flavobacterium praedii]|uniref:sensor histidine kinase n=1 Tax=Flavobacterium praedii TaxID=3002900 RepID=UPI0024819C5B|nr:sensor histidine kinase [Flavobacterium praedii]
MLRLADFYFMYKFHTKTFFFLALAIAILLSLSPMLILIAHHSSYEILDKVILFTTAFLITFCNLFFQNWLQSKEVTVWRRVWLTAVLNFILFGINIMIRIPFWNKIFLNKPPFAVIAGIDLVRHAIIVLVTFWVVSFLRKMAAESTYKIKVRDLENQTLQLQLKNLTAQLQPHFFFNSLNVLAELIHIDVQKSDQYIQHLSNIFRYVLTNQERAIIDLEEEINFVSSYLFLLKIRFDTTITVTQTLTDASAFSIPSLCTLVVLENIVKHNNVEHMKITISLSSDKSYFVIANSLNKKNSIEVDSLGIGLANIEKRCQLLLQKSILIQETDSLFEVKIPLKIKENEF